MDFFFNMRLLFFKLKTLGNLWWFTGARDLQQSCPAIPQVADREDPLSGGFSGYNTENLTMDHCGGCVWRKARLHALKKPSAVLDKSRQLPLWKSKFPDPDWSLFSIFCCQVPLSQPNFPRWFNWFSSWICIKYLQLDVKQQSVKQASMQIKNVDHILSSPDLKDNVSFCHPFASVVVVVVRVR